MYGRGQDPGHVTWFVIVTIVTAGYDAPEGERQAEVVGQCQGVRVNKFYWKDLMKKNKTQIGLHKEQ